MHTSLPSDLVGCLFERLSLRDLYACFKVCQSWQQMAVDRRDSLRLLEPQNGCCVRGGGKKQLHHPGAMVFVDGFDKTSSIILCEQERLRLMSWSSPTPQPQPQPKPWVTRDGWLRIVPRPRGSSGPCGLALALEEGTQKLFVSDIGADRVYKFSIHPPDLRLEGSVGGHGTEDGQLVGPGALAISGGLLFVAEGDRVSVFDHVSLAFRFRFGQRGSGHGQFKCPSGLAIGSGEVFVADMNNHRVNVFAEEDGAFLRALGRRGTQPGEFRRPAAVSYVSGRLLVSEFSGKRVQVLSPQDGAPLQLLSTLSCGAPARIGPFLVDEATSKLLAPAAAPAKEALHTFRLRNLEAAHYPG